MENAASRAVPQGQIPAAADIKSNLNATHPKQHSPSLPNRLSESPELTRTMINSAHNPMKRVGSLSSVSRGSKAAAA